MSEVTKRLATDQTLGNTNSALGLLAKDATLGNTNTALGLLAKDATLGNTNTALGLLAKDTTLGNINTALGLLASLLAKDSSLQAVATAINNLPNATQQAADNANEAAAAATAAISQLGGLVADTYSSSKTYKVGDYVYQNGYLYKCISEITTAEQWTPGHWEQTELGNDVSNLKSALNRYDDEVKIYKNILDGVSYTEGKTYTSGYGDIGDYANTVTYDPITLLPNTTYVIQHAPAGRSYVRVGTAQGTIITSLPSYAAIDDNMYKFTTPSTSDTVTLYLTGGKNDKAYTYATIGTFIPDGLSNEEVQIPNLVRDTDVFVNTLSEKTAVGSNLLTSTYTDGYYYSSGYDNTESNSSYGIFAPIPLESNTVYSLRNCDTRFSWVRVNGAQGSYITNQLDFIDNGDGTCSFVSPHGVNLTLSVTCLSKNKGSVYVAKAAAIPVSIPNDQGYVYIKDLYTDANGLVDSLKDTFPELGYSVVKISVSKSYSSSDDGYGVTKFSSIIDAVNSITDSSASKRYVVTVEAGTDAVPIVYDEWNTVYAGHVTGNDYVGVIVPRYVTITTTAPEYPNRTVLYMDGHAGISDTMTYNDAYQKSLFHLSGKCFETKIQGFTLRAKDCRYAFHAESNVDAYGMTWYLENCIIDWLGSDYYSETGWFGHAVGLGIGYGGKGVIKNCKWIHKQAAGNGITGHTNGWNPYVPQLPTMPGSELEIINCDLGGYDVSMGNSVDGNELNNIITFHNVINCNQNTSTGWKEILKATEFTNE